MRIITGNITNGVTLGAGDGPVLIGGVITNDSTTASKAAVYGGSGTYVDIRNTGRIGDTTQTASGIRLLAGGTITNGALNATDAVIEGTSYGMRPSGPTTVTNYGSIFGSAAARFLTTGMITNGSTADTAALISGSSGEGISFGSGGGGVGTVANFGTITSAQFFGVQMLTGGRVANGSTADTQALITGYGDGIQFQLGDGTVSNFGTIVATYAAGIGILSLFNGTSLHVTNGSNTSTDALITSNYGIVGQTENNTVTNFATVSGTGFSGEAVDLAGGTIVNGSATSTAALLQGHFAGVYLKGTGKVTNYGKIEGGSVGVLLTAGGTIVNGSSSDKTALIGNGIDGIDVSGVGAATITNFGTIEGAISAVLFGDGTDKLIVESGAAFVGAVSGGSGTDMATFAGGGTLAISNFSGFENFVLSTTSADTLTLTNANFAGVTNSTITLNAGSHGDTVNASPVTGSNRVVFVGAAGADNITAGGSTTMTGGGGANEFIFTRTGTNTITDFGASSANEIVLSNSGFHLGLSGASATPQALPSSLFVSNSAGTFTNATQRFAYDTASGELYYDADGNLGGSSRHGVVALTGHPSLAAADLFFVT